jgi:endo-1,4-beta-D-glucanase Y
VFRRTFVVFVLVAMSAGRASANQTDPFLWPYNVATTGAMDAAAQIFRAWQEWKAGQITSGNAGGGGRLRVMGGVNNSSTVSEGQAYGILFASLFDDQAVLDGLWLFTADHLNARGLMDWHVGNPGQRLGTGAATDGDEDMALGLLNACIKVQQGSWPPSPRGIDYCARAADLIEAIYQYEVDKPGANPPGGLANNRGNELLPGDFWTPVADYPQGIVNLSYFAPGFYTVFGKFTGKEAEWAAVISRNYGIVNLAQSTPANCSRLVPNWTQYNGDAQWVPWQPTNYAWWSYDAARLAWRVAVDKRWYNTTEAAATINEIGSFFSSVGFGGIGEHSMDGWRTGGGPWPFFVANAGVAIWAADQLTPVTCGAATGSLKESRESAYARVLNTRDTPNSYYGNAWRLFALLLMTENFPNFYEIAGRPVPPPSIPVPSPGLPLPPPAGTLCEVSYEIVARWTNGFHANVTVTNRASTPISGYTLRWTFISGEAFSSGWNANYAQAGNAVTASNPAGHWNGTIGANGGSLTFGFIGTGNPAAPVDFRLNGASCQS